MQLVSIYLATVESSNALGIGDNFCVSVHKYRDCFEFMQKDEQNHLIGSATVLMHTWKHKKKLLVFGHRFRMCGQVITTHLYR